MDDKIILQKTKDLIYPDELCLFYLGGSRSFGYSTITSDYDYFGYYFSRTGNNKLVRLREVDGSIFPLYPSSEILNPKARVFSVSQIVNLWSDFIYKNEIGQKIIDNRHLLLGKDELYESQIKRLSKNIPKTRTSKSQAQFVAFTKYVIDLLKYHEVYIKEHVNLLKEIRQGKYELNDSCSPEWFKYLDELKNELTKAYKESTLPNCANRVQFFINVLRS